jgi:hypothetical protein
MFALDSLFHEFGQAVRKILSGSRTRWAREHPGTSGTLERLSLWLFAAKHHMQREIEK